MTGGMATIAGGVMAPMQFLGGADIEQQRIFAAFAHSSVMSARQQS